MSLLEFGLHGRPTWPELPAHAVESREEFETERGRDRPAFGTGGTGGAAAMVIHNTSADGTVEVILQIQLRPRGDKRSQWLGGNCAGITRTTLRPLRV